MKSKKITKWKSIVIALVLILGFVGYYIWDNCQKAKFQENYGQYTYYVPEHRPNYKFFEGEKAIFYNWEVVKSEEQREMTAVESEAVPNYDSIMTFGHGYFVNSYMKLKNNPKQSLYDFNRNVPEKGEYWRLAVYKLVGEKLERKEFDIFKMVRSFDNSFVPSEIESTGIWIDISHQKKYVRILLHPKHSKKDEDYKVHFIDLDEGKILPANEVKTEGVSNQNNFVSYTSFHDNLIKKGVIVSYIDAGLSEDYPPENLKKTVLAKNYPDLYKIIQGHGGQVTFLNKTTDVALVKNVTELFFPPGTNVFENVTIPAKYSVDGQEHVINSAEELQKYYKEEN